MKKYLKFAILGLLVLGLYFYLSMDSSNEEFELAPSISTESNLSGSLTSSGFYKLTKEQLALTASQTCPEGYELKGSVLKSGVDMAFVFKPVKSDVDQNLNLLREVSESHQFSFLKFDYKKYTEVEKALIAKVKAGDITQTQAQAELAGNGFYRNFSKYYDLEDVSSSTKFLRPFEPLIVVASKPFKYCGMSDSALLSLEKDLNPENLEPKFWNIVYLPEMSFDSDIFEKIYSSNIFEANDELSFIDGAKIPKGVYRVKFKDSLAISSENPDVRGSADVLESRIQAFLPKNQELTLANDVSKITEVKSLDNLLCGREAVFDSEDDRGPVDMINNKLCSNFDIQSRMDFSKFEVSENGSDLKISRSGNYYELPRLLKISYKDTSGLDKVIYFHKSFVEFNNDARPDLDIPGQLNVFTCKSEEDCTLEEFYKEYSYSLVSIETFKTLAQSESLTWGDISKAYYLLDYASDFENGKSVNEYKYDLSVGESFSLSPRINLNESPLIKKVSFDTNLAKEVAYVADVRDVLLYDDDYENLFSERISIMPLAVNVVVEGEGSTQSEAKQAFNITCEDILPQEYPAEFKDAIDWSLESTGLGNERDSFANPVNKVSIIEGCSDYTFDYISSGKFFVYKGGRLDLKMVALSAIIKDLYIHDFEDVLTNIYEDAFKKYEPEAVDQERFIKVEFGEG
jgi:hypothetical protein